MGCQLGCPISVSVPGQVGWGLEQVGLVKGLVKGVALIVQSVPAEGVRNIVGTDGCFECDEQLRPPVGKVASVSENIC